MGKKTFDVPSSNTYEDHEHSSIVMNCQRDREWEYRKDDRVYGLGTSLLDPLFQDLDRASRYYLSYCE